jgi:hypothetical protein
MVATPLTVAVVGWPQRHYGSRRRIIASHTITVEASANLDTCLRLVDRATVRSAFDSERAA